MPTHALPQAHLTSSILNGGSPASAGDADLASLIELMGARMYFSRNAEIYGEGELADYLYKVVVGTVRTCKVLADGRRQIGGFHLPGDIFGLEMTEEHAYSAEAVTDATVLVVRKSAVLALAKRDGDIARQLWASTARELSLAQRRVLLLIKSAQERLAGFLLEMAEREPQRGAVELTMTRQDIADYLGLTIETVSRTLTSFQDSEIIELAGSRRISLRDRTALQELWA
jgi:CRP-like cAMP-binding protein